MRLNTFLFLLCMLVLFLTGCTDMPSHAPIDDRTATRSSDTKKSSQQPEQVTDAPGFYTVKKGDTLFRIAQQFSQNWRDLVDWNSLSNPNEIKLGQTLRVAPPEGVRTASVPLNSGMEMHALDGNQPVAPQTSAMPSIRVTTAFKTGPLGNKVLYSDQALADLQRGDVLPAQTVDAAKNPADKLNDKPNDKASDKAADKPIASGRFIWPTDGKVINGFDAARKGIDIAGQSGQAVVSASDGTVLYAKNMRGYGNLVIVDHSDGVVSAYAHNKTILVNEGQTVSRGQRIAEMGDTDADRVKLHFEIRQLGKAVDPTGLLPTR